MLKWLGLLARLGFGSQPHFSKDFFSLLDQELHVVDDYKYVGIDFRNDPDLVLPEGDEWEAALGKKKYALSLLSIVIYFYVFIIFYVFGVWHVFHCFVQIVH